MQLEGKVAVVYGAAGPMGGAVARSFAAEGAQLFLAGRTLSKVQAVADEIESAGGRAQAAEVDVDDRDAVERHAAQGSGVIVMRRDRSLARRHPDPATPAPRRDRSRRRMPGV